MQLWHWAMLAVFPLMMHRARLRIWLIVAGASLAAALLPVMAVEWYIVVDLAAGVMILRRPIGCAQRIIGALFAMMMLYSVGYILAGNKAGADLYLTAQDILGWLQWGCLLVWGAHDVGEAVTERVRAIRRLLAPHAVIR